MGVDRDCNAQMIARELKDSFGEERFDARVPLRWSELLVNGQDGLQGAMDAVVMDLGMSKAQMDDAGRGFSFKMDASAPLDMRMDGPMAGTLTAADILNTWDQNSLKALFFELGEQPERRAAVLAEATIKGRPWKTVGAFANMIRKERTGLVPKHLDPATLPFQALRMAVNDEVNELIAGLMAAQHLLKPNGKLVVLSYHSIEDRVVKKFMRFVCKPLAAGLGEEVAPSMSADLDEIIRPTPEEVEANPRASSAILRVAQRTSAPPVSVTEALHAIWSKRRATTQRRQ